jgi:hypothetical protein
VNTATNAAPVNTDMVESETVVVTLDSLCPMWGEGKDETEAMHDLVMSIGELLTDLRENRDRLGSGLGIQLERLEWEFENRR